MEPVSRKGKIEYIELSFNPDKDADILARLDGVDSKQGYMRMLIWNDLVRRGIIEGSIESVVVKKGRPRLGTGSPRNNLKLISGGPDQPIIDYLKSCQSKIDYVRSVIRQDIDDGGTIADSITTPKDTIDPSVVVSSVERVTALLQALAAQDDVYAGTATDNVIAALTAWISEYNK